MAIYRNVSMSFWTDSKVSDDFSPEEKYMFLYLFTNPHTNLSGCYEISMKQMAYEMGYSQQKVKALLDSLSNTHDVIRYNNDTKEVLLLNWHKYNWTESEKFRKPLLKDVESIKCDEFKSYLMELFNGNDTVSIGYQYPIDTTVTVSVTDTVTDTVSEIKEIVDFMNEICGTQFKADTKDTKSLINARLKEGYTVDDFKTVIYKKTKQWKNDPKMCGFLRPKTLFGTKFESYLNEKSAMTFEERLAMA